jgi:predicted nucleic acid-binding protein
MSLLLDTCVLSEMVKPQRNEKVVSWLAAQRPEALYVSALTLGEMQKGIDKLPPSVRKTFLETYLQTDILEGFKGRILDVDSDVALAWGTLVAKSEQAGQRMPSVDCLIAATALRHQLTVVTRNTRDMAASGVTLFDPWQA